MMTMTEMVDYTFSAFVDMLFSLSTVWKSSPSCFEHSRRTHGMTINALARLSRIGEAVRHVGVTNYGLRAVVDA